MKGRTFPLVEGGQDRSVKHLCDNGTALGFLICCGSAAATAAALSTFELPVLGFLMIVFGVVLGVASHPYWCPLWNRKR